MGGQILATDVAVRVVMDGVANVSAQGPIGAANRIVELERWVAVVDGEEDTAFQSGGRVLDPAVCREADLSLLALDERDALGREPVLQCRGGGRSFDIDELVPGPADEDL